MTYLFSKLRTTKDVVKKMPKNACFRFRTPFDKQHAKGSKKLPKSARQLFLSYFSMTLRKMELGNVSVSDIFYHRTFC